MRACWFGLTQYARALEWQHLAWKMTQADQISRILGFEHPAVITLGKRASLQKDVFNSQIPVRSIDRGGQATLHSPGQLVIYPVVDLRRWGLSVKDFVMAIQLASQKTLEHYGIKARCQSGLAGLTTDFGKICSIGIRVEKSVTRHGLAINVCNDLSLFTQIRACGMSGAAISSVHSHGVACTPRELFAQWSAQWVQLMAPDREQDAVLTCQSPELLVAD